MKNFVVSVVASLVASVVFLVFSLLSSVLGWTFLFAVLCGVLLLFAIYLIIANKCSTNPLRKLNLKGHRIGIKDRDEQVFFNGISLLRPNYIRFQRDNGSSGYVHYSKVIVFV